MEITGFNESKTGQKGAAVENAEGGRADMRTEVKRYTTELTIDNVYELTWDLVVKAYLISSYTRCTTDGGSMMNVVVDNVTYQILKGMEVTSFFDASGNILFEVDNKRLEEEYEWMRNRLLQAEYAEQVKRGVSIITIQHFTETQKDPYGATWANLVREYLKTAYSGKNEQAEVVSWGITYKVLKRKNVTVFYDASGNTLFDVTNERLEKEYEWLMNSGAGADMEHEDSGEESGNVAEKENNSMDEEERDIEAGEAPETEQTEDEEEDVPPDRADDDVIPMGKTSLKEIITGLPAPTVEEIETAREENAKPVKQRAKVKLEKELKANNNKTFAEPIIGYLLKRCAEDEGLAQDVMQEHKTWNKCVDYIFSQARKQSSGNCAAVRDDVVYEWAEDYYHRDDKAEEEKKAKKKAENKAKSEKPVTGRKNTNVGRTNKTSAPKKVEVQKEPPKPTRNGKDMEGQIDMFSMMGM